MSHFFMVLIISVLVLVLLIVKLGIHPVISLFIGGMIAGLGFGYGFTGTITTYTNGFGSTLGSIGCTIIFGSIIAQGIRDTGSVKSMVNFFTRLSKGKNMELSTGFSAYIMSIPVFGDITEVLMAPLCSLISKRANKSMSTMAGYTMLGCSLTHSMVPPTPGILAVALLLGADLGLVITYGIIITWIAFFITWFVTKHWVAKEFIDPRADYVLGIEQMKGDDYHDLLVQDNNLPHILSASSPILIPIILIALSSFANMNLAENSNARIVLNAIGERNIALFIGVLITFILGAKYRDKVLDTRNNEYGLKDVSILKTMTFNWVNEGLQVALLPLIITAMGGGFSAIIKSYPQIKELGNMIVAINFPAALVPVLIGIIMMISVGSRTTAGMTAAAICAPIMTILGLSPVATTLLIGSGTVIGSHVSDSGFWIGTSLFNLNTKQGLKYITVLQAICGVFCIIITLIIFNFGLL